MNEVLLALIAAINPAAVPLVATIVLSIFMYLKFKKVESDRIETKQHRDNDSQTLHDDVLKLKFDVSNLSGIVDLHKTKLESIDQQVSIINQELVKLNLQVEHLVETLNQQNQIMMRQLEVGKK